MRKADSRISRRGALIAGGGALALGALAATPLRNRIVARINEAVNLKSARQRISLAAGSYEDWLAQVDSIFTIAGGSALKLSGVRALPSSGVRPAGLRGRAFVATFDPVSGGALAGDLIYTATHRLNGPLQIFLSASTDSRTLDRMLAVFN